MAVAVYWEFLKGTLRNRWMVVAATVLVMSAAGGSYNFGLYSQDMKVTLGYTQKTVNTIAFFRDLGANIGIVSGFIYDHTGPRTILVLGACFNTLGYLIVWMAVTSKISTPAVWIMCVLFFVGANSQSFANTGVTVTCVRSFSRNRGIVMGLVTGFVGLSGAVLTLLFQAVYGDNPRSFILFSAWLPSAIYLVFVPIIRIVPAATGSSDDDNKLMHKEAKTFYVLSGISFALAAYMIVVIVVEHFVHIGRAVHIAVGVIMVLILLSPILVVVRSQLEELKNSTNQIIVEVHPTSQQPSAATQVNSPTAQPASPAQRSSIELGNHASSAAQDEQNEEPKIRPRRGQDFTVWQALTSLDMWYIFVATTCGLGSVLAAIDNLGQLGTAWGYSDSQITTSVSLLSIWNFMGRVGSGFISEVFLQRNGIPRPFFFALVLFLTAIGHLVIALKARFALYMASVLAGFCLGAQLTIMFTMISELFGLKYFATLYSIGAAVATPLGTYLLSVLLAGRLYDREVHKQQQRHSNSTHGPSAANSELVCYGIDCYRISFLIMFGVCIFGCLMSMILGLRTRSFYISMQIRGKR